ncbi:hypothetical protein BDV23DRAFT_188563 [Aspergillus alliaceus]|uniref:AMP-dependent synthetase/ligase domain-containing protein n=1 Tax=Petromyces alliaceus TaxID=209559 RepID=A0A5N7BTR4_PETAA|nr:hypothetical protein BDV23DRAFT_188563 [Aspergillus alliaceus]
MQLANHAAWWLSEYPPETSEPFQCIAYSGPKDFRFAILALAAAKLQEVMVLPSPLVTGEAQLRILEKKNCTIYLRPPSMASQVDALLQEVPHVQVIEVPETDEFMQRPKLFRHPKPITYTQSMVAGTDLAMSLPGIEDSYITSMPAKMVFIHRCPHRMGNDAGTRVFHLCRHDPGPGSAEVVFQILHFGQLEGALLPPGTIDELCQTPAGFAALQQLNHSLPSTSPSPTTSLTHGNKLPSTNPQGQYSNTESTTSTSWPLPITPNPNPMQLFNAYTDRGRFETSDLWEEYPVHKGLWKIIGRTVTTSTPPIVRGCTLHC